MFSVPYLYVSFYVYVCWKSLICAFLLLVLFAVFVFNISIAFFYYVDMISSFQNVLYVFHVPPNLSLHPPPPPPTLPPHLYFTFNQSCPCASCDFVMWLLHGADDVVFADQQKVNLFCSQSICEVRDIVRVDETWNRFMFYFSVSHSLTIQD